MSGHSTDFAETVVICDVATFSVLARSATARSIVGCREVAMLILTAVLVPSVAGVALPGATTAEPRVVRPGDVAGGAVSEDASVVSAGSDVAAVDDPASTEPGVVEEPPVAAVTVADEVVAVELPQLAIVNTEPRTRRAPRNVGCMRMPKA